MSDLDEHKAEHKAFAVGITCFIIGLLCGLLGCLIIIELIIRR